MASEVCGVVKRARAISNWAWSACVDFVENRTDCFPAVVARLNGAMDFLEQFFERDTSLGVRRRHPRFEIETLMPIVGLCADMACDVGFIEEIASALWDWTGATALISTHNVSNTLATTGAVLDVLEDFIDQGVAGWAVSDDWIVQDAHGDG